MDTTTAIVWTYVQLDLFERLSFEHGDCITGVPVFDAKMYATAYDLCTALLDEGAMLYYGMPLGDGVCTTTLDEVIRQCALATTCAEFESISRDIGIKFFEWQSFVDMELVDIELDDMDAMYIVWYVACGLHVARVIASL